MVWINWLGADVALASRKTLSTCCKLKVNSKIANCNNCRVTFLLFEDAEDDDEDVIVENEYDGDDDEEVTGNEQQEAQGYDEEDDDEEEVE